MSRRGNCHDNAVMESFFSTVKSELADRFHTYGDAKMELLDYIFAASMTSVVDAPRLVNFVWLVTAPRAG